MLEKLERNSKPILRIAMSLVFLYFGFMQASSPLDWAGFVPDFLLGFGLSANNFVMMNSILELTLGTFLLFGLYTRISSFILALHLLGITLSIGFSPIGIRDFGLTIATFVVFLNGVDKLSLDKKISKSKEEN